MPRTWLDKLPPARRQSLERTALRSIHAVWDSCTPAERTAFGGWYADVRRQLVRAVATSPHRPTLTVRGAAAIVAALSPMSSWDENLRHALAVIAGDESPKHVQCQVDKVYRLLAGDRPEDVLSGPKETAFYLSIADPRGSAVTVDRHMTAILWPDKPDLDARYQRLNRAGVYDWCADLVRAAAKVADVPPPAFQAILWCKYLQVNS